MLTNDRYESEPLFYSLFDKRPYWVEIENLVTGGGRIILTDGYNVDHLW